MSSTESLVLQAAIIGVILGAMLHHRLKSSAPEIELTRRASRHRVSKKRRCARHSAAVADATLIDVNNVRGATMFDSDVDAMCASLYRWAVTSTSEETYTVLAIDHGLQAQAVLVGGRVVFSFAGEKLSATADDMIEVGAHYCTHEASPAQRVLIVSSDVGSARDSILTLWPIESSCCTAEELAY